MVKTNCDICNRTFKDESGLAAHNSAKHSSGIAQTKKKSYAIWFYLGLSAFVIIVLDEELKFFRLINP